MRIYHSIEDAGLDLALCSQPAPVVTLGTFDGVHAGHRALLQQVARGARACHGTALAIVFAPHPQHVLRGSAPVALTSLAQRLELMAQCGIACIAVVQFDAELAAMPAVDFARFLCDHLKPQGLVLGYDFRFGHGGLGSIQTFRDLEDRRPSILEQVSGEIYDQAPISSSRVRRALAANQLSEASAMLGRHYAVRGDVVRGQGRGRGIGYPTANILPETDIALPTGIYAGWATQRGTGSRHAAAISLGYNPTFETQTPEPVLEAHLLDFDADLYGQSLEIEFVTHLRGEQRFSSASELVDQIALDVMATRRILGVA